MSEIGWRGWRCDPHEVERFVVDAMQEEGPRTDEARRAALEVDSVMGGLADIEAEARREAARAACETATLARDRQAAFLAGVREAVLSGTDDARVRSRAARNASYREGARCVERMSAGDRAALREVFLRTAR